MLISPRIASSHWSCAEARRPDASRKSATPIRPSRPFFGRCRATIRYPMHVERTDRQSELEEGPGSRKNAVLKRGTCREPQAAGRYDGRDAKAVCGWRRFRFRPFSLVAPHDRSANEGADEAASDHVRDPMR